ncbi:serine hydrolase domain-containing protein [Agromyces indicus]|uniref:Serine hydrolase domain-containing protein n=1 Tax=Agromyces indicus TaxID=758919 RepID=A0ABU1FHC5_9MICO|nr:serine hydrolase domain-containing protein [Agromyces indicus]MDR5691154.1 serine hydrolase domain-containing protein [Agromyces indicus]
MTAAVDFATRLDRHLARVAARRGALAPPQVAVHAPGLGITYRSGELALPFHGASVGKLFTATLTMQAVEAGAFTTDTPVSRLLPGDELAGLFDADGSTDAAGGATVHQLLAHTAGVADYFEGPVTSGRRMVELVHDEPDRFWTPRDLLDFSRERQRPVGRPGERFRYSDTGYVLLGRLLEESTASTFHDLLHERIFEPVGMIDSSLWLRSRPAREGGSVRTRIAPVRIGRRAVTEARSVSCDWAGGGVASTLDDLVAFSDALHHGRLIGEAHLRYLAEPRHRFRPGIRYGAGMMQVRFEGFSPFLRGLPRPVGHIGVLATHVFHDPVHDAEIVLNFGGTREMVPSFRTLIEIERALQRVSR